MAYQNIALDQMQTLISKIPSLTLDQKVQLANQIQRQGIGNQLRNDLPELNRYLEMTLGQVYQLMQEKAGRIGQDMAASGSTTSRFPNLETEIKQYADLIPQWTAGLESVFQLPQAPSQQVTDMPAITTPGGVQGVQGTPSGGAGGQTNLRQPPLADLPFRNGLTEQQKTELRNLVASDRQFNQADAQNFIYGLGGYGGYTLQQIIGKRPSELIGAVSSIPETLTNPNNLRASTTPSVATPGQQNVRRLGPTEFESLQQEWTQAFNNAGIRDIGIINEAIEINFLKREGGDIFLKTDSPSIQQVIQGVQARGTPVVTPEGGIRYVPSGGNLFQGEGGPIIPVPQPQPTPPPAPTSPNVPKVGEPGAPTGPTWPTDPNVSQAPLTPPGTTGPGGTGETPPEATPPTPPVPETPTPAQPQPGTDQIVQGMLAGFSKEVKDLISQLTTEFGQTIEAYQHGQQINEAELMTKFNEIKEKNINPYYRQLITNYQSDLLFNLGLLTGQRQLEMEVENQQFAKQVRETRQTLEASGMTFSGEALRVLGAYSAFGPPATPGATPPVEGAPVAGVETPEGEIPAGFRQVQTSSRARNAQQLREIATQAERQLGTGNVPAALTVPGLVSPTPGEPQFSQFLSPEAQVGEIERQRRAEELASLQALRELQTATGQTNALATPL